MNDQQRAELSGKLQVLLHRMLEAQQSLRAGNLEALAEDLASLAGDVDETRDAVYGVLHPEDTEA